MQSECQCLPSLMACSGFWKKIPSPVCWNKFPCSIFFILNQALWLCYIYDNDDDDYDDLRKIQSNIFNFVIPSSSSIGKNLVTTHAKQLIDHDDCTYVSLVYHKVLFYHQLQFIFFSVKQSYTQT